LDIDSKYSHSDLVVHYGNGEYVVVENFKSEDISIPKGTKILKIDGQLTNDYIKSLQHKIWLRFDPYLKIPYSFHPSPFITYGDESKTSWYVEFQDANDRVFSYSIPKLNGFRDVRMYPMYDGNILCKELAENIAYIRVFLLPGYSNAGQDLKELENFFARANGKYKKLIIDLRRNYGGSPAYGGELLIRPFIKKPSQCIQYAAVKKDIYNKLSKRMALIDSLEKDSVKEVDFGEIRRIKFDELPDKIKARNKNDELFYYFKTTKLYEPLNHVNFDGKIFLLIDNYCFSATEDIIRSFKELKIAKIVGTSSLGGAAAVLQPWIFELPNSHILFTLEVELAFNSDGTVNEIYGTKPDVELEPSTYPTSFPESFSREDLINDKWISWIMNN
jgi:hypothetical protein